jgi:phage nucleotide-binding protein
MTVLTEENAGPKIAGLDIRKAGDRTFLGIFMALYGQGGSGKTTLAAEVYKVGRTLLLDAESGTDSISHLQNEPNLDIVDIVNYKQFDTLINALKQDSRDYVNIVVDNLVEIIDFCEDYHGIKGNDSHDLQNYKLVKRDIIHHVKTLRDIARTRGINVIMCAWDADEKDNRGVVKKDLAFTPALRKEFPGICTIIGHIDVLSDPDKRRLDFAPSPKSVSKFKRSRDSAAIKIPYKVVYDIDHLPLADIINTAKGVSEWPSKKYSSDVKDDE